MAKKSKGKQEDSRAFEALFAAEKAVADISLQHMASPWLKGFLPQKLEWHKLFIRTFEAASSIVGRNISPDLFSAYRILGSRWFSHHEAVEVLLGTGRYGDCMVLLRSLLEDTDLMTYFAHYPVDTPAWIERLSREPVWSDKVYRQGIQEFSNSRIWNGLRDKGVEPLGQRDYSILSAAVHSSPWGIRFYGGTLSGDPDQMYLALVPNYDYVATLSVGLVLQGTYPRPIDAFLTSCAASRVPRSLWRTIEARYVALLEGWQAKMELDSWFRIEMDGVQERISRGEEPEAVLEDVRKRFEERYGQAVDSADGDTPMNNLTS